MDSDAPHLCKIEGDNALEDQQPLKTAYFIDNESPAETVRLIKLADLMNELLELFPERLTQGARNKLRDVVDIACGPGSWTLDVAHRYSAIEAAGIDISETLVGYAAARARSQGLTNASFERMDSTKPLNFPDNCFDFLQARFLFGFLRTHEWPQVTKEYARIVKPGGMIRLLEVDNAGQTNSDAFEFFTQNIYRAMADQQRIFRPRGTDIGVSLYLKDFLKEAGCKDIEMNVHVLDFSSPPDALGFQYQENWKIAPKLLFPWMVKAGIATPEELDRLYNQFLVDLHQPTFRGILVIYDVTGIVA